MRNGVEISIHRRQRLICTENGPFLKENIKRREWESYLKHAEEGYFPNSIKIVHFISKGHLIEKRGFSIRVVWSPVIAVVTVPQSFVLDQPLMGPLIFFTLHQLAAIASHQIEPKRRARSSISRLVKSQEPGHGERSPNGGLWKWECFVPSATCGGGESAVFFVIVCAGLVLEVEVVWRWWQWLTSLTAVKTVWTANLTDLSRSSSAVVLWCLSNVKLHLAPVLLTAQRVASV